MNVFYEYSIYKHFKGNIYRTLTKSKPLTSDMYSSLRSSDLFEIFYTDGDFVTEITKMGDLFFHPQELCKQEIVLYRIMQGNNTIYGRPMSAFLGEVDKEKYPKIQQKYRFERIFSL